MSKTHQTRTPAPAVAPVRPAPAVARTPARPHAVGNQALQQLLDTHAVQAKLTVTPPTDAYEQEAERVADEVMRGSPTPDAPTADVSAGAVSRAAKAESKDEKKKPEDQVKRAEAKKPEDDKKVKRAEAKKPEDDKKVKRTEAPEPQEDEEKVQRSADGSAVPDVSPELERTLNRQAGGGQALSPEQRSFYEPRFNADLGNVRLHTDTEAAAAARDLRAEAFTRGSDVYFAAGKYQPQSDGGRHLIAHELTHTLQQSGGGPVQTKRAATGSGPLVSPAAVVQRVAAGGGVADPGVVTGDTLTFDKLPVPKTKFLRWQSLYAQNLRRPQGYDRDADPTDQRGLWQTELAPAVRGELEKKQQAEVTGPPPGGLFAYQHMPAGKAAGPLYFGTLDQVARDLTIPRWSPGGAASKVYEVDHILELQLSGENATTNMELLEKRRNASSGSTLMHAIRGKLSDHRKHLEATGEVVPDVDELKSKYTLVFKEGTQGKGQAATDEDVWAKDKISDGKHMADVHARNVADLGSADKVMVMIGAAGTPREFAAGSQLAAAEAEAFAPFRLTAKTLNTAPGGAGLGTFTFAAPPDHKHLKFDGEPPPVAVNRVGSALYLGSVERSELFKLFGQVRLKHFSPVEIDTVDVAPGKGLLVSGRIQPDIPVLRGASLDFLLVGDDLTLFKTFSSGEVQVPRPFVIDDCSLTAAISTQKGLSLTGRVDFGVQKLGRGFVEGRVGTSGGFGLVGGFDFDSKTFDPAKVTIQYADGKWSGEGTVGIPEGKLKGVKSATITVGYADEVLRASGSAELSIPGVRSAGVLVNYSEADGLTIKGNVNLADGIPGIRGGSAEAEVKQSPAGDWSVTAKGTATPAIPGIDSTLDVAYDNGAITISGHAALNRGMLKGDMTLGATNRAVDDQGNPTGPPGDALTAFGSGSATITFTPWLEGTAGVRLKPNGEIEVTGRIGLPSAVDVFPEKKVEKNLFSLGMDIPIVGVAVAGQRIGIFATIRGGLDASAGFGPGQLRKLFAEVTYNPAHEEDTVVRGHGEFHVPAHAGLRLSVRGGLGVGIPIVSASANLEVGGQLGIEGAADAAVDVNWSPRTGLQLDATASLSAQPKFKLDVTGLVLVEADLLVSTITLYEKRWQLAAVEFGSDMTFGLTFPIHYKSGEPFDVKLDDVQFQLPEIDPGSMLRDLFAKIA